MDSVKMLKPLPVSDDPCHQANELGFWPFFVGAFAIAYYNVEGHRPVRSYEHLKTWARMIQDNKRVAIIGPRRFLKSSLLYAYILWQIKRLQFSGRNAEWFYFSYTLPLAQYHLKKVKRLMRELERLNYYPNFKSLSDAESILHYKYGRHEITVEPSGVLIFKRGVHGSLICDDILKDERSKGRLSIAQLQKITEIFMEEISFIPGEEQQLLLLGTPQDTQDLFFQLEKQPDWKWGIFPAITDGEPLWPEVFPLDKLARERRLVGDRAFNKEMLCSPARLEESYLDKDQLTAQFVLKEAPDAGLGVGGHDIGKRAHPSHASIFRIDDGVMYQLEDKWMEHWDYTDQVEWWTRKIEDYGLDRVCYDNTRGEFEALDEQGKLPSEMEAVSMSGRKNQVLASELSVRVSNSTIWFRPSEDDFGIDRQFEQMLAMDNDLKAPSSAQGHADCYAKETQVLTRMGWKYFPEVRTDDEIASLNPETNELEYLNHKGVIKEWYEGLMYGIHSTQIDLLVTPQHRLWTGNSGYRDWKFRLPEEVFHLQRAYSKIANWEGKERKFFVLPEYDGVRLSRTNPYRKLVRAKPIEIDMDLWLEFLGYYISEGYTTRGKTVHLCQNPGEIQDRMINVVHGLPFGGRLGTRRRTIHIYSKQLAVYLEPLGHAPQKYIPQEFKELSSRQLGILFEALMKGDGAYGPTFSNYDTSSSRLADDVQEIVIKIGKTANIYVNDYRGREAPHGFTRHISYRVGLMKRRLTPMINRHGYDRGKFTDCWEDYRGFIYDVILPRNHIVLVRRNGKPVWSSNSFVSNALACHAASELLTKKKGPLIVGVDVPGLRKTSTFRNQFK